jgi:hypothetical protein
MARTPKEQVNRMSEAVSAERTRVRAEPPRRPASQPADPSKRVTELQVSAHLMTLESGLFCVFPTPGSAPPDPATGLPGVRITPAPGIAGRPEAVSVSTFREDGWLNGTAALVRVTDGSAQILVTIYQHKGMDAAPRLQVLRLNGEPTVPDAPAAPVVGLARPAAEPTEPGPAPEVMAHIQRTGDLGCKLGEWLGQKGSRQWIEGFGMAPANGIALEDIEYQAVLGRNWLSPWIQGGKFCGSRGMALPLLGLKVRLKGPAAKAFECSYSATFVDGSAVGPVSGGETCEAESLAALEALQIVIHPHGGKTVAKGPAGKAAPPPAVAAKPVATWASAAAAEPVHTRATKPAVKAKRAPKPPAKGRART